jgi:sterol desaturase/sphingolipid hydroxylase (fatty acid hydroxylase superfamily)
MEHFLSPQVQVFLKDRFRLSLWLAILTVIFVPLERLFAAHPQKIFRKQILTDLGYYFLSSLLPAVLLGYPVALLAWSVRQTVPEPFLQTMVTLPILAKVVIGLIATEIGYYWGHRLSHEIPFLWKFHSIHHSAEQIDYLVNTRAHPIDMVFGRFCGLIPLYIIGLGGPTGTKESLVPVIVTLIGTIWGFFIHANVKWRFGPLEWLISTPAFHHWHHTRAPINRNYASTLPWIDVIFGTFYLPVQEFPDSYGIKARMPDSLVDQLFYPLERSTSSQALPQDMTNGAENLPDRNEAAVIEMAATFKNRSTPD